MQEELRQESHYVPVGKGELLHLNRISAPGAGTPVFMLHGTIEDGRIFYSRSGKGLAPYLARNGFDVYVGDWRGHGKSQPSVVPWSSYGQKQGITEDIPALVGQIVKLRGEVPMHWVAHSWGGVLMLSHLARCPEFRHLVASLVLFGSCRVRRIDNWQKLWIVALVWNRIGLVLSGLLGYFPARALRLGTDNEHRRWHSECVTWVRGGSWRDLQDGFDYGEAIKDVQLPPILSLAGGGDVCLGHPGDVQAWMAELGQPGITFKLLSRANGNRGNYDHTTLLTHPEALDDHFPLVRNWLMNQMQARIALTAHRANGVEG